jgi:hypothetical protein
MCLCKLHLDFLFDIIRILMRERMKEQFIVKRYCNKIERDKKIVIANTRNLLNRKIL